MPDSPDYRLYLGKCIKDLEDTVADIKADRKDIHAKLDKLIESNLSQLSELRLVKEQTTKSNGRIGNLEDQRDKYLQTRVDQKDVSDIYEEIEKVDKKVDNINEKLLEVWFFIRHPKVFFGIITFIVLATLGFSIFNNRDNQDIRKTVNDIKAYVKIPFAPERGGVAAYPDTIKVIKK